MTDKELLEYQLSKANSTLSAIYVLMGKLGEIKPDLQSANQLSGLDHRLQGVEKYMLDILTGQLSIDKVHK
jgi:hypothetical protein